MGLCPLAITVDDRTADRQELLTSLGLDWEFPSGDVPMGWEGEEVNDRVRDVIAQQAVYITVGP